MPPLGHITLSLQQKPMNAGALHTIIADGVWTPQRAHKLSNNSNGKCLLCGADTAGVNHIWWDCPALNKYSDLVSLNLNKQRETNNNKPERFWNTGVISKDWTTLPTSEHMYQEDICHPCKGTAIQVCIDGSSYKLGASNYSGWGIWSPYEESFNQHGPLKGSKQSSDRAEVRALLAASEKAENNIEVITDNQYVRDTAQYIAAGGMVHKGKRSDL
eukprot:12717144-Heterocapsa_arctica.AAC.1